MIIDYIKLKGFRSYIDEVSFSFNEGINVIIGANGSGKTSTLKALRLLLLDKSDATLEEFVNRDSASFFIEVKLDHLGHTYRTNLKYTLKSKTSERELYIDEAETPQYNTTSSVKDFLKTVFDPDLTYYAIALHQGSSEIINAKDSARLELFKKIRNIDFNKQAEELKVEYDRLSKDDLNTLDLQLMSLNNKTYSYSEKTKLPYSDSEIDSMKLKIENLILQINTLGRKEKVEADTKALYSKLNTVTLDNIENEIKGIQAKIDTLVNTGFKEQEKEIEKLASTQIESHLQEIEEDYNKDIQDNKILQEDLKKQVESITIQRVRKLDFASEIAEINKHKTEFETELKQISSTVKSLESGICPVCGKETTPEELAQYEEEYNSKIILIQNEKEKLLEVLKKQEENNQEIEANERVKEEKSNLQLNLDSTILTASKLTEDYEKSVLAEEKRIANEQELASLKLNQAKLNLEQDKKNNEKDIEASNTLLGKVLLEKEEAKNKIKELNSSIEEYEKELTSFPEGSKYDLTLEKEFLEKKIDSQKNIITRNNLIDKYNEDLKLEESTDNKKKFSLLKEKDILNSKVLLLKEARNILLKHFPNFIISASIEDTENAMNDFLNIVYPKDISIKLKSTATSLKMTYGKGRKLSCSNLSGAEEILVSLAFINSLNKQLDLDFMFMDEVDAPLTASNSEKLFDSIQNMNYKQLVIVTHNDNFKSKFQAEDAKIFEVTPGGLK